MGIHGVDVEPAPEIERHLAAMQVRRLCNGHACRMPTTGTCEDPLHRQHVEDMSVLLDMLGLDQEYPQYSEADKATWLGETKQQDQEAA